MSAPSFEAPAGAGASYSVIHHFLGCAPDPPHADQICARLLLVGHDDGESFRRKISSVREGWSGCSCDSSDNLQGIKDAKMFRGRRESEFLGRLLALFLLPSSLR